MTRWFHAVAGALLLAVIGFGFFPAPRPPTVDPQTQLIDVMAKAGLLYVDKRPLQQGEAALSFSLPGCAAPVEVIYLPWINRVSPSAQARIHAARRPPLVIHDGEVTAGLGVGDIMPRWMWLRLLVALNLKANEPWTSALLVVLFPTGCQTLAVDWASLIAAP